MSPGGAPRGTRCHRVRSPVRRPAAGARATGASPPGADKTHTGTAVDSGTDARQAQCGPSNHLPRPDVAGSGSGIRERRYDAEDCRQFAAPLAHAFSHLFNLPEVMGLLRDREKQIPYWQSVLEYCVVGNLQATLDEYARVLVESLGLAGKSPATVAK